MSRKSRQTELSKAKYRVTRKDPVTSRLAVERADRKQTDLRHLKTGGTTRVSGRSGVRSKRSPFQGFVKSLLRDHDDD